MQSTDHLGFNKNDPFYEMVTSYMVSLAACPSIFNKNNPMNLTEEQYISVQGILLEGRHFKPYEIYELAQKEFISQERYLKTCCIMLTNTAYESVKEKNDKSPEFEFFRHLRNASSHANTFNFFKNEPALPASWRGNVIDHNLKGQNNPLYGKECFGTFMGLAEIIDLLSDLQNKLI